MENHPMAAASFLHERERKREREKRKEEIHFCKGDRLISKKERDAIVAWIAPFFLLIKPGFFSFRNLSSGVPFKWTIINGLAISWWRFFCVVVRLRHSKKKRTNQEKRPSYVLLWFRRWPNDDAQVRLEGRPLLLKHTVEKKNRQLPTAGDNRPCIRSIVSPGGWLEEAQQQQASNGQKCLAASSQNKWRGKEEENGIVGEQGRRMLTSSVDHATHAQPSRLLRSKKTKTLDKDAARTWTASRQLPPSRRRRAENHAERHSWPTDGEKNPRKKRKENPPRESPVGTRRAYQSDHDGQVSTSFIIIVISPVPCGVCLLFHAFLDSVQP